MIKEHGVNNTHRLLSPLSLPLSYSPYPWTPSLSLDPPSPPPPYPRPHPPVARLITRGNNHSSATFPTNTPVTTPAPLSPPDGTAQSHSSHIASLKPPTITDLQKQEKSEILQNHPYSPLYKVRHVALRNATVIQGFQFDNLSEHPRIISPRSWDNLFWKLVYLLSSIQKCYQSRCKNIKN